MSDKADAVSNEPLKLQSPSQKGTVEKRPISIGEEGSIGEGEVDDGSKVKVKNEHLGSTQQHAFTVPEAAARWNAIYEEAKYEGRHRYDPMLQWSASEEKKLVRKVHFLLFYTSLSPCHSFARSTYINKSHRSLTFE